ncbi:unnamed protein product [Larinioides sclopetarius]|uniref:Uncharacterized protein n=1 Tax=Larinioides sclopetarius TaxID=280406 RepID=A0AAV2AA72_9ARAC
MEKREVGRKSTRTVPVIIENHENAAKKTKLMVPSNYTAGQLVNILRSRMHLRPYHPVYLFLKSKQSPVLMSKSIGHLHHKHRDEKGLLRLIHAGQTSFGFRGNIRAIRFRQKWIENHSSTTGSQPYLPSFLEESPFPSYSLFDQDTTWMTSINDSPLETVISFGEAPTILEDEIPPFDPLPVDLLEYVST